MALQVVVGAGAVGVATARLLAARGDQVRLVSRRGTGPEHPSVERVGADATDSAALARIAHGAVALYNCAAPPYHRWTLDWPPLANALLDTAEATGAVLVSAGNLYLYGPVDGPLTEDVPARPAGPKARVRARMWQDALARHEAGRIRTADVRASDHIGAGSQSMLTLAVLPRVLAGRRASVPADLDAPRTWTAVGDVARTLVAVADDEHAWGRAWHVPSVPPLSVREVVTRSCALADAPPPRLSTMPGFVLWLGGFADPLVRELRETQYQFRGPFIMDSTAAVAALGITATPIDESLAETVSRPATEPARPARRR
ncbi:NAD-dependent epimerase/dehydratase family protein [Pseudonocardia sp. DSM 110487]|uniref:NAD-dependent epimerase/dehydratase family protein n=1 Tax=Pseudonocardia sp. DSM 110487 TaxID=2865833 RepID=UPI001C697F7A|nr:NAD-dependent epimerase/dehydratase family protein [Pseudonocardia sp. DSM 110487]QYN36412.1 NAD-dependent epimerase/dehydratase family protein [Pseudonocardia sp. DSM 110487]